MSDTPPAAPDLPYGLRKRLTAVFLVIILAFSVLNAFNVIWISLHFKSFSAELSRQANLQELISELRSRKSALFNYSRSGNADYLDESHIRERRIRSLIQGELVSEEAGTPTYYKLRDISRMIVTLNELSAEMLSAAAGGIGAIYLQDRGDELVRLSDYIIEDLQLIAEIYMDDISRSYRIFARRITRMTYLSFGMLFLAMFFAIYIVRRFVVSVTMPVHKLAIQLVKFGDGDMETRIGDIGGRDEIAVLGRSFDSMADRIRVLIGDIKDKAEIEQRLVEQRLAREEVERLFKEAELAHLQAQINPHFLFNTLNILGSLSVIENAHRTGSIIADLSELLRYSLRTGSGLVTLKDEIDVIRSYMNIQQFRFDGKITYRERMPEQIPELRMPGMILQPLAENSVKHGLEPIERRGTVTLSISIESDAVVIDLTDDGVGISDKALELLGDDSVQTDSLGIRNVQRRLALHYERDVLRIRRLPENGTSCCITLPVAPVFSG